MKKTVTVSKEMVEVATGEVGTFTTKVTKYIGKVSPFSKVYHDGWTVIDKLESAAELKIYAYIQHHMLINRRSIVLHYKMFRYSKSTFYLAIAKLIEFEILQKGEGINYYYVNTDLVYNGKT